MFITLDVKRKKLNVNGLEKELLFVQHYKILRSGEFHFCDYFLQFLGIVAV